MHGCDDTQTQTQALAAFGLAADIAPPEPLGVWPDNWDALQVFYRCRTQWATGPGGVVGLRLEVLPFALRLHGVPRTQWPEVVDGVQALEAETLRLWTKEK